MTVFFTQQRLKNLKEYFALLKIVIKTFIIGMLIAHNVAEKINSYDIRGCFKKMLPSHSDF